MGRRRNPPLSIIVSGGTTEVTAVSDGLPAFKRYIDVYSESERQKKIVRWFFVTPSQEEINDTTTLYRCKEIDVVVLSASMPYMPRKLRTRDPLFEYCLKKGFSEEFSTDLVRLVINFLEGKRCGYGVLSGYAGALQELMNFLATHTNNRSELTLKDINKQVWLDYLSHKEAEHRPEAAKIHFNSARGFFKKYQPTSLDGWLNLLSFRTKNHERPSQEHTSELASTSDYPNVIMYQLLALFTEGFQRRVGYLMHFERLTEADMPQDWIYPGRKKCYLTQKERGKTRRSITETSVLFSKWLHDEDDGYQILIDHYIMYYKAGLVNKNAQSRSGFRQLLKSLSKTDLNPLVIKFHETMGRWHGFDYERHSLSLLNFYVRKKTSSEKNIVINQITWCLANLLMMQTGVNKEVALTIPSRAENGESILTRGDSLFISNDDHTEIELHGFKERTGNAKRKVIPIPIPKGSPLYQMLIDYERHVKVQFDGPFFEIDKNFKANWNTAGCGRIGIGEYYPVLDENGEQLSSIVSTRFRKVFASGQLLERLQGIKDGNELAEKLRDDLRHGNLDVTITNYLMKSSVSRGVIDTAIATITAEKLEEGLRFKGKIALDESSIKKKVFLCDCQDPNNPSHNIAIADECRHYDACLGCEQSVVTKVHLPYICARIIQYEEARHTDPHIWPALFEDRWNIAHDALDRYVATDKRHGQRLVEEAWVAANKGLVSLPPIIVSNRI